MTISKGKFERLDDTVYGGRSLPVPLFVDREHGLTGESNALLYAARIIGGKLHLYGENPADGVDAVAERASILLDANGEQGCVIEDELGAGAISINPSDITVAVPEVGVWSTSTERFFSMLHDWNLLLRDFKEQQ